MGETEKSRECNILDMKNKIIADKDKENKRLANEIKGLKEGCKVEAGMCSNIFLKAKAFLHLIRCYSNPKVIKSHNILAFRAE